MNKEYDIKLIRRINKIKKRIVEEKVMLDEINSFNEGFDCGADLALDLLNEWVKELVK